MTRPFYATLQAAFACALLLSLSQPLQGGGGSPDDPARYITVPTPAPYWGYSPGRVGGALHGAADVVRSTGQFLKSREQARLLREAVRQKELETRMKLLQHYRYERELVWNMHREEEKRIRDHTIERARNQPTEAEMVSGYMLNTLHRELAKQLGGKLRPKDNYSDQVRQDWLDAINFTTPDGGNAGLLREKEIIWPPLLQEDRFADLRAALEACLEEARTELRAGKSAGQARKKVSELEQRLDGELTVLAKAQKVSPNDFIGANRFLKSELVPTRQLLENPKGAAFLLGTKPQGGNVAELVQYMNTRGVTFAPATLGGGQYYLALHSAFTRELDRLDKLPQGGN